MSRTIMDSSLRPIDRDSIDAAEEHQEDSQLMIMVKSLTRNWYFYIFFNFLETKK